MVNGGFVRVLNMTYRISYEITTIKQILMLIYAMFVVFG